MELFGVISDVHGPWVNQRNLELAIDVFQDQDISHLIIDGDFVDFYCVNSHGPKHPLIEKTLEDEIFWANETLDYIQKTLPGVKITYIYGNHEDRLDRFIIKHCPIFWNYLRLENMLRLEERGIEVIPYNMEYQVGKSNLYIQHSPPSYSANSAANTSLKKKVDRNYIWGCSHRSDMAVISGSSGKVYDAYCLGWFGSTGIFDQLKKEMPENKYVFSYTKNHENWNCSFIIGTHDKKDHTVNFILVKDYKCQVGNTLYEG